MTYITGGAIQATDYNTFATLSGSINELYSDLYPGATTLSANANFGYGVTSPLTSVNAGDPVTALQWGNLYQAFSNVGTHQGTVVVPPLPGSPPYTVTTPAPGSIIESINTIVNPLALQNLLTTLQSNRNNIAPSQSTLIPGTTYTSISSWTLLLTYTFEVDFGSWDNARYFFNSGGYIGINGSYTTASAPGEIVWQNALNNMSPLKINWNSTTPNTGSGGTQIGFWNTNIGPLFGNPLSTSHQVVYERMLGVGYYTTSYVEVNARLTDPAGTNGKINFMIRLVDDDPTPDVKVPGVAFKIDHVRSSGTISYPGPAVIITDGGFTYT